MKHQPLGVMARVRGDDGRVRTAFFRSPSPSDRGDGALEQARDWLEAKKPKRPPHPLFAMMAASYRTLTR